MTTDFHERLAQRKQEILNERLAPAADLAPFESEVEKLKRVWARRVRVWTTVLLFLYVLTSCAIMQDWWGFIGTPEYHQYKAREVE